MYQHDLNYVDFFFLYERKPYRKSLNILRNHNFLKLKKLCTYPSYNIFAKIYDLEMKDMMKIVFTPGADFLLGKSLVHHSVNSHFIFRSLQYNFIRHRWITNL